MPRKSTGFYPPDWPEIARRVKDASGWRCIRCEHPHDPTVGRILTVHHLDMKPGNNRWWNLLALCQVCHLQIQHKVFLERPWLFEHSAWFRPYVAGWNAFRDGLPDNREYVMEYLEELLRWRGNSQELGSDRK